MYYFETKTKTVTTTTFVEKGGKEYKDFKELVQKLCEDISENDIVFLDYYKKPIKPEELFNWTEDSLMRGAWVYLNLEAIWYVNIKNAKGLNFIKFHSDDDEPIMALIDAYGIGKYYYDEKSHWMAN